MSFHSFTACTKGHEGNKKEHSDGRARDSEMECLQLSTSLNFDKNFQKFKKKKKKKKPSARSFKSNHKPYENDLFYWDEKAGIKKFQRSCFFLQIPIALNSKNIIRKWQIELYHGVSPL